VKILIVSDSEYIPESEDLPEIGTSYLLEDATYGTSAQNRTFHALLQEYWKSGLHPKYGGDPFSTFKDQIKRTIGAGFESYVYADIIDGKPKIFQASSIDEIPDRIRKDPDMRSIVRGRLKSWADYTKKERQNTIDNIINDMLSVGVSSKKFDEILSGIGWGS